MKVYKHTYIDKKSGERKECKRWYLSFTDKKQTRRQLPAFSDKKASERAALMIELLLSAQGFIDRDLQKWIEEIPVTMRNRLIKWDLIGDGKAAKNFGKSLLVHLEDYRGGLLATGRKAKYVGQTCRQIQDVLDGCGFKSFVDIDGNAVLTFLDKGRGPDGYGEGTFNAYLRSFKMFCAWMIREDRGNNDPMKRQSFIKQTEFRKKRRALTLEEMNSFLKATEAAPTRYNMTGHERTLVYKLCLQTGLRADEVKHLRKLSFDFDNLTVHVEANTCKSKRADDLILMPDTAKAIQEFLRDKEPTDIAFALPGLTSFSIMIQKDLADAGIEYRDDAGRDCDFHAQRGCFITNLALAGVLPAVAQEMARHSDVNITMKHYTHVLRKSKVEAIDALKSLTSAYTNQGTQQDAGGRQLTEKVG